MKPFKAAAYTIFKYADERPIAEFARTDDRQRQKAMEALADALARIHGKFVTGFDAKAEHVLFDPKAGRIRLVDVENAKFWKPENAGEVLPIAVAEMTRLVAEANYLNVLKMREIGRFISRYSAGMLPLLNAFAAGWGLQKASKKDAERLITEMFAAYYKTGHEAARKMRGR